MLDVITKFIANSGFANLTAGQAIMICVSFVLFYLAIKKGFEPLLLIPIAFGMLMSNLPLAGVMHPEFFTGETIDYGQVLHDGGVLDILYLGVKLGVYPPLIFMGIGAMTDFSPLIANPKTIFLGAAAQLGIFGAFSLSLWIGTTGFATWVENTFGESIVFTEQMAASVGIIGGADGPTAILTTKILAPELLPAIAVAAYSYMALVPLIQPPIMRALTTKKERAVVMDTLRPVGKTEKIIFPIAVTAIVSLIVPDAASLVGLLMFGNLLKESGCAERLVKTASNELINIVTIMLGVTVGATASADNFLKPRTLIICVMGLMAFSISTAGGVLLGKLMYLLSGGKVNPLIGSAGVSAVPMAARVSNNVGRETNPNNYLLMNAMGPNVAGVIGSAVAAGVFISMFKV